MRPGDPIARWGAAGAVVAAGTMASAQDRSREAGEHQKANESFFGPWMFVLVLLPIALAMILAAQRRKSRPPRLPTWDDTTFDDEVVAAQVPVLVQFSLEWSVANRAAIAQTEILQYANRGAVKVGLLDVTASPETMARFPGLEAPAYLLFHKGRKLFHRPGLWQADDLQVHIDRALADIGF